MLDYTIELISLAASNSLAVFCFCNLIIAILLIGRSSESEEMKPNNAFPNIANDENFKKSTFSALEKANDYKNDENFKKSTFSAFEKANDCKNVVIETAEESVSSVSIDMVDCEEKEEDEDNDDDELKRRAEEFIEKINRGWRAEKMNSRYS